MGLSFSGGKGQQRSIARVKTYILQEQNDKYISMAFSTTGQNGVLKDSARLHCPSGDRWKNTGSAQLYHARHQSFGKHSSSLWSAGAPYFNISIQNAAHKK